jgi:lysozyme
MSPRLIQVLALSTALAVPAEGLRQYAYKDPAGILTICYGSTSNVKPGQYATLDECKSRLNEEMIHAITQVDRCVPNLPENVLAAFSDATYNIGPRIACDTKNSTAARLLKSGNIEEACRQLPRWNKVRIGAAFVELPGLTTRRNKEMELCLRNL